MRIAPSGNSDKPGVGNSSFSFRGCCSTKKTTRRAIPRHKLEERFTQFVAGWLDLVESARQADEQAQQSSGDVPPEIARVIGLGRFWGIVVGDMLRRLVARTMAQEVSTEVEEATSPFQYDPVVQPRATQGARCRSRAAQAVDPDAIVQRGNQELPTHAQGFKVLGILVSVLSFQEHKQT